MRVLVDNKKLSFDYFIESTLTCGIVLTGWEVKAFRASSYSSTSGCYIKVVGNQLKLIGLSVSPVGTTEVSESDRTRDRQLLATSKQIRTFIGKLTVPGTTLGMSQIIINDTGLIKVEVAFCKGKRQHDKRASIKERDVTRSAQREIASNIRLR